MTNKLKLIAATTAAALSAGCASGGGGPGGSGASINGQPATLKEVVACIYTVGLVCPKAAASSSQSTDNSTGNSSTRVLAPPSAFKTWAELPANTAQEVTIQDLRGVGAGFETTHSGSGTVIFDGWDTYGAVSYIVRDVEHNRILFDLTTSSDYADLASIGHPGLERLTKDKGLQSPFLSIQVQDTGVLGNPYALGWQYQSFGVWATQQSTTGMGSVRANSFGAATHPNAMPGSGSATFTGKLGGLYVSPSGEGSVAAADLTVNANFSTRTLGIASKNTVTTRDFSTAVARPDLNISGALTLLPGSNGFSGAVANAGGTISGTSVGQFYGPSAQELGGVINMKSPATVERFVGAYGAKR